MIIIDNTNEENNGRRLDEGVKIYPFLDEGARDFDIATSGYIRVNTWDIRHTEPLDEPEITCNIALRDLTLEMVVQFQVALDKVREIAMRVDS